MRITNDNLSHAITIINNRLGITDPKWNTVGAVAVLQAYGGTAVVQVVNKSGGIRMLHNTYGTKREAYYFLRGMMESLTILQD